MPIRPSVRPSVRVRRHMASSQSQSSLAASIVIEMLWVERVSIPSREEEPLCSALFVAWGIMIGLPPGRTAATPPSPPPPRRYV